MSGIEIQCYDLWLNPEFSRFLSNCLYIFIENIKVFVTWNLRYAYKSIVNRYTWENTYWLFIFSYTWSIISSQSTQSICPNFYWFYYDHEHVEMTTIVDSTHTKKSTNEMRNQPTRITWRHVELVKLHHDPIESSKFHSYSDERPKQVVLYQV